MDIWDVGRRQPEEVSDFRFGTPLRSYNEGMEVAILEAEKNLTALVTSMLEGEQIFLTNNGGQRVAELVPSLSDGRGIRGFGCLKDKVNLYPGWDSEEEDKKVEEMFEGIFD